jgi:hypothetical protein
MQCADGNLTKQVLSLMQYKQRTDFLCIMKEFILYTIEILLKDNAQYLPSPDKIAFWE